MRRWYSTIDNKTNMELIYSECSLNEVGYELEVVNRLQVYGCVKNNNNGMYEITTKTRTFYYDEDRGMLLGE